MVSKKNRKRYEEEIALFMQGRAGVPSPDSDEAYEAFRRHIEEHIQGETRAFHQLRSEAETKFQPSVQPLPAPPSSRVAETATPPAKRKAVPQRNEQLRSSQPVALPRSSPLWFNGLLCLSFAALGGLGYQGWQQWQQVKSPKVQLEGRAKPAARTSSRVSKETLPTKLKGAGPCVNPEKNEASVATAAASSPVSAAGPNTASATGPLQKALITSGGEVRKGPSAQYEILDVLPAGTTIEGYLTSDRLWLRLEGGRFLALSQLEILDASLNTVWLDRWVGAKTANIRALPAMQAAILKKLNQGEVIKISLLNKQWARLEDGGYIYLPLVSENDPRPLRLPATMRVLVDQATIYTGPGAQFAPIGVFFKNHKVEVTELREGWFRIGQDQFIKVQDLEQLAQNPGATRM